MRSTVAYALCTLMLSVPSALAAEVDYAGDIKPILKARCYACHGALRQKSDLRLDAAQFIRRGGEGGPIFEPGNSAASTIIERVSDSGELRMPPAHEGEALSAVQIASLKRWIDAGAPAPDTEEVPPDPRQHWAFIKPIRPAAPAVKNTAWVLNPVDAFLAALHEQHGLAPAPQADKSILLRRVHLDLTGLPPTRDDLNAFAADASPDAYERIVDKLLASPAYGERWGRHWMDIWRFSDWYGNRAVESHRRSRRFIWRWRDWIIESVNADKGYDQMIVEMLAGDELAPSDPSIHRATGYLGRSWHLYNRNVWMQEVVEYTGTAFLGLTLKCCRCHDHKYDPISQKEYYQFRAFFEPYSVRADALPGKTELSSVTNATGDGKETILKEAFDRVYDADPSAATYVLARGNEKNPIKDESILPGVPKALGGPSLSITPVPIPYDIARPELRTFRQQEMIAGVEAKVAEAKAILAKQTGDHAVKYFQAKLVAAEADLAAIRARLAAEVAKFAIPPGPEAAKLGHDAERAERLTGACRANEHLQELIYNVVNLRAKLDLSLDESKARVATAEKQITEAQTRLNTALATMNSPTAGSYQPIEKGYPLTTTGRRLAVARWIASRDNPLTARVAANHIWLRHFGAPLVPNVGNFGLNAKPPLHPALLDWLAAELMDHNWSTKHLHRMLVTSRAYRMQSSAQDSPSVAIDPENRFFWRMNARRMEGEVIRDAILQLAGTLNAEAGGPDVDPTKASTVLRRSVYFRHTPDDKPAMLQVFDAPNPEECFRRIESVMPQQALALANGDLSISQARRLARALSAEIGAVGPQTSADFIQAAFETLLARLPSAAELRNCREFLTRQTELLAHPEKLAKFEGTGDLAEKPSPDPQQRAREGLVHVIMNHHDFVTIH